MDSSAMEGEGWVVTSPGEEGGEATWREEEGEVTWVEEEGREKIQRGEKMHRKEAGEVSWGVEGEEERKASGEGEGHGRTERGAGEEAGEAGGEEPPMT